MRSSLIMLEFGEIEMARRSKSPSGMFTNKFNGWQDKDSTSFLKKRSEKLLPGQQ